MHQQIVDYSDDKKNLSLIKILQYMLFGILGTLVFSTPPIHLSLSNRPVRDEVYKIIEKETPFYINEELKEIRKSIENIQMKQIENTIKLQGVINELNGK
jgi:hypothetical protein